MRKYEHRWRWCARPDSNRHGREANGFSRDPGLSPPLSRIPADYAFTLAFRPAGAPRLVSTPSLAGLARRYLVDAGDSPNLKGSTSRVSPGALKFFKSVAATNYATGARKTFSHKCQFQFHRSPSGALRRIPGYGRPDRHCRYAWWRARRNIGGASRNRTDVDGFAIRLMTTLPSRHDAAALQAAA